MIESEKKESQLGKKYFVEGEINAHAFREGPFTLEEAERRAEELFPGPYQIDSEGNKVWGDPPPHNDFATVIEVAENAE